MHLWCTYTDVGCNVDKTGINEILINIKKKNYETFKNSEGYEKHKQNQQKKYNQMKQDPVKYSEYKEKKLERYYELKKVIKINN